MAARLVEQSQKFAPHHPRLLDDGQQCSCRDGLVPRDRYLVLPLLVGHVDVTAFLMDYIEALLSEGLDDPPPAQARKAVRQQDPRSIRLGSSQIVT